MKPVLLSALIATTMAGPVFSQDSIDDIFAQWDLNANGQVSVLEARSTLTSIFASFDTNLDGYLDGNDTAQANATVAPDGDESAVALEFDDTDGDGRVSLLEFINQDDDWVALMDRDADGTVTVADFNSL
jgi:Ca2+-binding EF-hand superfamily protein